MERIVLHCDMDRFFATVEEKYNPSLRRLPIAVCGDPAMRHNIVMSANSLARQYGVRAGLRFTDAQRLCPSLQYIKADDRKYLAETKAARDVYYKYSDTIIPYSLDESWVIMEDGVTWHEASQIAELIRLEIMYSMDLSASVGVSYNLIFSKIGSELNKPNGLGIITRENYKDIIWPMAAKELLFVGEARERTLTSHGIRTIGDVANADPVRLCGLIKSKAGYDLKRYANGDDRNFHPQNDTIGSIGNTITPPKDLRNNEEVSGVLYLLATAVCARLRRHGLKARCVSVHLKDNQFNTVIRQSTLAQATDGINRVFNRAFELFKNNYAWVNPLRSVGVRVANLDDSAQRSLFDDEEQEKASTEISNQLKLLTAKFGKLEVESASALGRW